MSLTKELSSWAKKIVDQITKDWDWQVSFLIDPPEDYQTSYQIFLTLKKLHLTIVILFDKQIAERKDFADLRDKINLGLVRLKELAEQRVIT